MRNTLVEVLRDRAARTPNAQSFTFLDDGTNEANSLTFVELDARARAIAARLKQEGLKGQRVLLIYLPGLDFVAAIYGCLYAGTVAVPVYPARVRPVPSKGRRATNVSRLMTIARDADIAAILTAGTLKGMVPMLAAQAPEIAGVRWLPTDEIETSAGIGWDEPPPSSEALAFIQYTSGSTRDPRGVLVSHANLMSNGRATCEMFGIDETTRVVSWCPMYHDMGLIGGVLLPVFVGAPVFQLSPLSFLQKPVRWLNAISDYRAVLSMAPNFAYDLCARRVTDEECARLDLSSWTKALNGAEPVRADVLDRFTRRFADCGFRAQSFYPCYGMAEATLTITGSRGDGAPIVAELAAEGLERGEVKDAEEGQPARRLVGCGSISAASGAVEIVDPRTLRPCSPDQIGEIWVRGPSVCAGYWGQPQLSEETFGARLAGSDTHTFLRTGDHGFIRGEQLFVAGRLKDMLIIHGRNLYPQDVEQTVDSCHAAVRPGCVAAFGVETNGDEQLAVMLEIRSSTSAEERAAALAAVRMAVADHHGVALHAAVLLPQGMIPKTSSGKIQRSASRAAFLARSLEELARWEMSDAPAPEAISRQDTCEDTDHRAEAPPAEAAIRAWLVSRVASIARVKETALDASAPLSSYGLGSLEVVELSGELSDWLGRPLPPSLLYSYPTVEALARHLAQGPAELAATPRPVSAGRDSVAVIGLGCRFPGASGPDAFWKLLIEGVDAVTEVPVGRFGPSVMEASSARWMGALSDVEGFDAGFFGISAREANHLDPQQRLLLEVSWEALEHAGQVPDQLTGSKTGVYMGVSTHDFAQLMSDPAREAGLDEFAATGCASSAAAGRLSYTLGFTGPCLTVDTACSSSLVAVHLACQSLLNGEGDLALAGGVNVILSPVGTEALSQMGALAPDGRCKTFDISANGYVRGEGCGVVVLKRLSDATRSGDRVLAILLGSAVNQDGRSNGLTAPNGAAQQALIQDALAHAQVGPAEVAYVEAHGTATALGDAVELQALAAALGPGRSSPLAVGSVKTNVGHLEAAAGIAGLIKTVLALHRSQLPPSLHFKKPNAHLDGKAAALLSVVSEARPWPEGRRLAGVSSFGFSGTNAHVVLEAPPPIPVRPPADEKQTHLLVLSARTPAALKNACETHRRYLEDVPAALLDLCATAALRRQHHPYRVGVLGSSHRELRDALTQLLSGPHLAQRKPIPAKRPQAVFVFPGQGSQWAGMGCQLLKEEPVFRRALEACADAIRPFTEGSLLDWLQDRALAHRLKDVGTAQPVIFSTQVALAALWRSWGVVPDVVVGHSMGEVAAAHVAGALSLDDAARIICRRSALLRRISGQGAMAVIGLTAQAVEDAIASHGQALAMAACNSRRSTVVSGSPAAVDALIATLQARNVFCRRIEVEVASHCALVDPLLPELLEELSGIDPREAAIPIHSTVTGMVLHGHELTPEYWARNLREPVLLSLVMRPLLSTRPAVVEISPHPILLDALEQDARDLGEDPTLVPSLRREADERRTLLESAAALHAVGRPLHWEAILGGTGNSVSLPTYSFQRERYWPSMTKAQSRADLRRNRAALQLGQRIRIAGEDVPFEVSVDLGRWPWLTECTLLGAPALPSGLWIQLCWEAARAANHGSPHLEQMELRTPLLIPATGCTLQAIAAPKGGGGSVRLFSASADADEWMLHGQVQWTISSARQAPTVVPRMDQSAVDPERLYCKLAERAMGWSPVLRLLDHAQLGTRASSARLHRSSALPTELWPAFLWEAGIQLALVTRPGSDLVVPSSADRLCIHGELESAERCQVHWSGDAAEASFLDAEGRCVATLEGLRFGPVEQPVVEQAVRQSLAELLYSVEWEIEARSPQRARIGAWLVLADRSGAGDALRRELEARGSTCLSISPDEVDLAKPGAAAGALELATRTLGQPLVGVAHMGALDAGAAGADLSPWQPRLYDGVLQLTQALQRQGSGAPRLWVMTRGAIPLENSDISIGQSPLWGLGRTAALEATDIFGGLVDLPPAMASWEAAALADELTAPGGEDQIALRESGRRVARLTRATIPEPALAAFTLKRDACYVITGGLGHLGLQLARFMAERGAGHLLLIGRRGAANPAELRRLEALGAHVTVASADVADEAQMRAALMLVGAPLRGVIHAAGIAGIEPLATVSPEMLHEVMRPKAEGGWVLHRLTRDVPLDFFILFSSASATWGAAQAAAYSAANSALDALAHHRRAEGLPALSINWGRWAQGGLVSDEAEQLFDSIGLSVLPSGVALQAMALLVGSGVVQRTVAAVDWSRFAPAYEVRRRRRLLDPVRPAVSEVGDGRASDGWLRMLAPERRAEALRDHIRQRVAEVLGESSGDRLDWRRGFFALGMTSLMAVRLRALLEADLGCQLHTTAAFEYPTADALSEYLLVHLGLSKAVALAPELTPPKPPTPLPELDPSLSQEDLARELDARLASLSAVRA